MRLAELVADQNEYDDAAEFEFFVWHYTQADHELSRALYEAEWNEYETLNRSETECLSS